MLQLLRKPKKQKGKAPPPLEFASHVFVADMLRRWCNPQWEWTHLPLGEKLVWLELKRKGKKLNEAQQQIEKHLRKCGFEYLVTDNVNEAISWLKRLGILLANIEVQ